MIRFFLLISLLGAWGCTEVQLTQGECEIISMHSFRGVPQAINKFKNSCKGFKLHYTKKLCEKALVDLISYGSQNTLEKKYGEHVMECFTTNDRNNFLKK